MQKNKLAFTLIELLVTIVLFTLLLATTLYSFRFMSINIRNINNTNPQNAMNYNLLQKAFASTYFYIDVDERASSGEKRYYYYFKGTKDSCRFISSFSYFYDELVLIQLTFKDQELWYEEGRIFAKDINYKQLDKIRLTKKRRLLRNILNSEIVYLNGEASSSEIINKFPSLIEMSFTKNKKRYRYSFALKSKTDLRLNTIRRDYELMKNQDWGL